MRRMLKVVSNYRVPGLALHNPMASGPPRIKKHYDFFSDYDFYYDYYFNIPSLCIYIYIYIIFVHSY